MSRYDQMEKKESYCRAPLKLFRPVFVVEQVVFYILRNRYVLKRHVVFAHERYSFLLFL